MWQGSWTAIWFGSWYGAAAAPTPPTKRVVFGKPRRKKKPVKRDWKDYDVAVAVAYLEVTR